MATDLSVGRLKSGGDGIDQKTQDLVACGGGRR